MVKTKAKINPPTNRYRASNFPPHALPPTDQTSADGLEAVELAEDGTAGGGGDQHQPGGGGRGQVRVKRKSGKATGALSRPKGASDSGSKSISRNANKALHTCIICICTRCSRSSLSHRVMLAAALR
uniref:Uncharacterized protein n=1 Tax=Anopheles melas TaxID=34690 RepID=A0A182U5W2_9DIPT